MYTSATQVSNFLQRSLSSYELGQLTGIASAVKMWLDKRLNSTFDEVDPSDRFYDGGVRNLDIDPCTNITQIEAINDDGSDSYVYTATYEIIVEPQNDNVKREIRKRIARFPRGVSRIKVTANFSEYDDGVPDDIQLITTRLVAGIINLGKYAGQGGNKLQESLEGHEIRYQMDTASILGLVEADPTVSAILAQRQELYVDNYVPDSYNDDNDEGGLLI